jgi:hypothetical protein
MPRQIKRRGKGNRPKKEEEAMGAKPKRAECSIPEPEVSTTSAGESYERAYEDIKLQKYLGYRMIVERNERERRQGTRAKQEGA